MNPVVFSFDVEEHYRIEAAVGHDCPAERQREYADRMEACTRWIAGALAGAKARATFFIVGQIAGTHPKLVRELAEAGHEIASHGWDHRRVHRFTPETFREDLRLSKDALEQASGREVIGYRAPTFSVMRETAWAIDVLAESGFQYDSSIFPVKHDRYGVPDAPRFPFMVRGQECSLLELPPVTWRKFGHNIPAAGGGYFRLFPPAIMRAAIRQTLRSPTGLPILYFHPWEFDPDQPKLPLGRLSRFRTYVGIGKSRKRLQKLLARYGSVPLAEAIKALPVDRGSLPVFELGEEEKTSRKDRQGDAKFA
ncbi:XrtA system polysaccharide deacetylase [Zavarzinella formosa]|uniref:XrtA system polysaccharide deacetylase n=1 Tax=Zavarzinella formosa TaxID=360055 RepID=UPI0002DDBA69|nr:XrtA system polysaccharide deacetylase [Zavarzinella formosa]